MILRVVLLATCLSIFPITGKAANNLGILGARPKWSVLESYQETVTHDEFAHLIYDVHGANFNQPRVAEFLHLAVREGRHLAQSGATALGPREILATCERAQAALGLANCARPGASGWRMGQDGRALVSSRQHSASAGR